MPDPLNNKVIVSIALLSFVSSCLGTIAMETWCNTTDTFTNTIHPVSSKECCLIPTIEPSLVTIDYNVIETGNMSEPWRLDALIKWPPPPDSSIVYYRYSVQFDQAVSLRDLERRDEMIFSNDRACTLASFPRGTFPYDRRDCPDEPVYPTEVNETTVVFSDLLYGFLHRLRIQVIAGDVVSAANICMINCYDNREPCPDTVTPDCLEATGDEEFCSNQPVMIASKPRNLTAKEAVNSEGIAVLNISCIEPFSVNEFGEVVNYVVEILEVGAYISEQLHLSTAAPGPFPTTCSIEVPIDDTDRLASSLKRGISYDIRVSANVDLSKYDPDGEGVFLRKGNTASLVLNISTTATTTPMGSTSPLEQRGSTDVPPGSFPVVLVVVASGVGVFVAAVLFALLFHCLPMLGKSSEPNFIAQAPAHTRKTAAVRPEFAQKEIFGDNIVLDGEPIGSGQYGRVYVGFILADKLHADTVQVAVKTTKEGLSPALKEEFIDEIRLMLEIGEHPNIMSVMGCCTVAEPYYLVIEYMAYGSLKDYLRKSQKPEFVSVDSNFDFTEKRKVQIVHQISAGMTYLSTTRYFHGDLAARNILVNQDMIVKISDFGLAIDIYQRQYSRLPKESKRPVKWYSPEANIHGRCSTKGDVWSFGIVLYEIYTFGGEPYPGMRPRDVIYRVNDGYRMEKPDGCPDKMYELMASCWEFGAALRPRFADIKKTVEGFFENWEDFLRPAMSEDSQSNDADPDRSSLASFTSDVSLAGEGGELTPDLS